mmetsp:Transcript_30250/g.70831  ORF Transcript_30250/g.70831 Transcript_30250/m.70831 type:complete len:245 (-) Transcript_30250:796-1530(-)
MDISRCSISSTSYALAVVLGNEFDSVVVLAADESDGRRTELTSFALAFFGIDTLKACFTTRSEIVECLANGIDFRCSGGEISVRQTVPVDQQTLGIPSMINSELTRHLGDDFHQDSLCYDACIPIFQRHGVFVLNFDRAARLHCMFVHACSRRYDSESPLTLSSGHAEAHNQCANPLSGLCFWALGVPNKTCAVVVVTAVDRPGPSAIPRVAQLSIELKSNGGAILIFVFLLLVICFDRNLRSD